MSDVQVFKEFVATRGVSLQCPGLWEVGLVREDALHAVDLAESAGVPILGGDVWVARNGRIELAYANWNSEPREGEAKAAFVERSCSDSRAYIFKYPAPPEGVPVFVLVPGPLMEQVVECPWEPIHGFSMLSEFDRFVDWIGEQVTDGKATEVPVREHYAGSMLDEKWFRHLASGQTWRLVWPDFPFKGVFERVL